MKVKIGLIMAISLIAAGCNPSSSSTPASPVATKVAPAANGNSPNTSNTMTTQVDAQSGIAFDYPSGWSIVAPPADGAEIYSYSIASYDLSKPGIGSENGLPNGHTKIDVTFYGKDETPDSARRAVQSDVESGLAIVVKEETRTAADGSPAYYYVIQGRLGGTAQALYTSVNGHTISIVSYGEGTNFEEVAKSLRST